MGKEATKGPHEVISPARIAIVFAAVAAVFGLLSISAQAATVSGTAGSIRYTGTPGEKSELYIYAASAYVVHVQETGKQGLTAIGTCKADPLNPTQDANCPRPPETPGHPSIFIDTGDNNDVVQNVYTNNTAEIHLGPGSDRIFQGDNHAPVNVYGDDGNDQLMASGRDGITSVGYNDTVVPGEGADKIAWGQFPGYGLVGSDTVNLAEIKAKGDKVQCEGADDTVSGAGKGDKLKGC